MADLLTPEQLVSNLVRLLDLDPRGDDRFSGPPKPGGIGRVFGGQVIAQALVAAQRTVDPARPVHSLHAYFLRGGAEGIDTDYAVHRDLDGGSFSNRRVIASQNEQPILSLTASFQRQEVGLSHCEERIPQVPPPEDLVPEAELRRRFLDTASSDQRHFFTAQRPIEFRSVEPRHWMSADPAPPLVHSWLRAVAPLPDDPALHRALIAYASDMMLLGTAILPHGLSHSRGELISASLDHAVWFHADARVDDWLLYVTDSPWSGQGRGFNRGRVFTRAGQLIATVAQEGMIRKARPKD